MAPNTSTASPDLISALGTSWFGAGLPPETVARLAEIAGMRAVESGDEVTREGLVAEALSIVVSGCVALSTLVPERGPAALGIQDRVFLGGPYADEDYRARRRNSLDSRIVNQPTGEGTG